MNYDLTIRQIKKTDFISLYNLFLTGKDMNLKQYETVLALAICFINANDEDVKRLGYRIIVEYCNQTNDYIPLYEIAINYGLYPVSRFIEKHLIEDEKKNFFTEWNDAFTEQYVKDNICLSEQQNSLIEFYESKKDDTVSVIAPTSYGKSELIIQSVKEFADKKICIVTSTKALLMQTKKRIQKECKGLFSKIVVHPEMYDSNDNACLAILTQERLLRIFKKNPFLKFDCIVIDEAHEMLEKESRSQMLSNVIIVAKNRNPNVVFKFLTPFLADSNNLKTRYTTYDIESFKVSEYIKTEKYYFYDLRNNTGLKLYDQFLDSYFPVSSINDIQSEEEVIREYSANKNIIYLNKPTDIERFALSLARILPDINSELIQNACESISDYLQPQYNLIRCLKKGIIYHHGSVPDSIRIYIEDLYKKDAAIKYVVTSSTLLSGVNLPAERLFILDNRRGKSYLSHDSFMNLIGRVCRFSEIFNSHSGNLHLLEPRIYLVFGIYFSRNANCEEYLKKVAKVGRNYNDELSNVLLEQTQITNDNKDELIKASEFIENFENGAIQGYTKRYVTTESGKKCIVNGITEFDVFENEEKIQNQVNLYLNKNLKINNSKMLLETINDLFLQYIGDNQKEELSRLKKDESRSFYSMMLDWRINNKSYSEMIRLVVGYWQQLYEDDYNVKIYVGKWGDVKKGDSIVARYIQLSEKSRIQKVNLAIVRIKEAQDFIDNNVIKYVEVLYDLGLVDCDFYDKIKYGTNDMRIICLVKNGLPLNAANLLVKKYYKYLQIDITSNTVKFDESLIAEMNKRKENQIQILEIQSCM